MRPAAFGTGAGDIRSGWCGGRLTPDAGRRRRPKPWGPGAPAARHGIGRQVRSQRPTAFAPAKSHSGG
jgi:hypothetical protein